MSNSAKNRRKFREKRKAMQRTVQTTSPRALPSNLNQREPTPVYEVREKRDHPERPHQELLSRARMQWQFGDWASLEKMDLLMIEHHPDRAELALLTGCAKLQLGKIHEGRELLKVSKSWGCNRGLMLQLLTAGVRNTLGRYHALQGRDEKASNFFRSSVTGLVGDPVLAAEARRTRELSRLPQIHSACYTKTPLLEPSATIQGQPQIKDEFSMEKAVEEASRADSPFKTGITSYAQNLEDVMLWRALGHVENGFYIDIGAQHPVIESVSRAFYENGWRGIHVEPTNAYAELLRKDRPDEIVIEACISDGHDHINFYEIPETGLSTGDAAVAAMHRSKGCQINETIIRRITLADIFAFAGEREIHWLKIDVEGMEKNVLESWGPAPQRPWVVVVESTVPASRTETHGAWESLLNKRDYNFVYFDGLSRFYLSKKHDELKLKFSMPPNVFDGFVR